MSVHLSLCQCFVLKNIRPICHILHKTKATKRPVNGKAHDTFQSDLSLNVTFNDKHK